MKSRLGSLHVFASFAALAALGCSSTSDPAVGGASEVPDAAASDAAPAADPSDAGAPDAAPSCAPPPKKSNCASEGAWVRGVAHFDPTKLKADSKAVLRVVLRHGFIMVPGEEAIGGRLHAWASIPIADRAKGEVPFAIDMCDLGTSMWSEENGAFHLVLMIDENDDNDLDQATSNESSLAIGMPTPGELVKMVDVDVSCNAPSACVDVNVDCVGGAACTTITPVKSCKKTTPGCDSDSAFCK